MYLINDREFAELSIPLEREPDDPDGQMRLSNGLNREDTIRRCWRRTEIATSERAERDDDVEERERSGRVRTTRRMPEV